MIENFEDFLKKRDKALEEKDFNVLYISAIKCAEEFHTKNSVLEAAFFLGRAQNLSGFNDLLKKLRKIYSTDLFNNPFISLNEENRFYEMGYKYPWLTDAELNYLEELYLKSDTYPMINRMLYDKELLRKELKHFNPEIYYTKNESFSDALCAEVFVAFLKNEIELNVEEALDERIQSFEEKNALASSFGFEAENQYPPIYVYNRFTNQVSLDTSTQLKDVFIFPITNFGMLSRASELFCEVFSDDLSLKEHLSQLIMERELLPSIERVPLCASWYLIMERYVRKTFNIFISRSEIQYVRNQLAKEWLQSINNKDLH